MTMEVLMTYGTTIAFASGFIAEFVKIKWSGMKRSDIDVTHMASPDGWKEFKPGALTDPGGLEIEIHFNPNAVPPIQANREPITVTWPVPPGGTVGAKWVCDGFMHEGPDPEGELDGKIVGNCKIKFSGKPTFTAST